MRGTAANEPVVSQAQTKAWDEGYERVFGSHEPRRGRWVWDARAGRLVDANEYRAPDLAVNAPVMAGRFYENTAAQDGTDIGSRARHRRYMREHGYTTVDDYASKGGYWDRAEEKRKAGFGTPELRRKRREQIAREVHRVAEMPQARYEREVSERARRRRERGTAEPTEYVVPPQQGRPRE